MMTKKIQRINVINKNREGKKINELNQEIMQNNYIYIYRWRGNDEKEKCES